MRIPNNDIIHKLHYNIPAIAKYCSVSIRTLQRYFRKTRQATPKEYIKRLRLNNAMAQLRLGYKTKDVTYALHYKQVSHFSREFKKQFGINPSSVKPFKIAV